MNRAEIVTRILAQYPADCQPLGRQRGALNPARATPPVDLGMESHEAVRIEFLGAAGGFSGARFWRLESRRGPLCLRRWPPEHPTPERLAWIHAVIRHAHRQGFQSVPVPLTTRRGAHFVAAEGAFWELTPWLPGAADYLRAPGRDKLLAALAALARFHQAVRSFPAASFEGRRSPGIVARRQQLRRLINGGAERLAGALEANTWPDFADRARSVLGFFPTLAPAVQRQLDAAATETIPLQPCLRDVWSDHILFSGSRITGIIDFGALGVENVAADLSRLLSSMAGSDRAAWQAGLGAYESVRPLVDAERVLLAAFDRSGLLMAGLNWIEWICVQGRDFADRPAVVNRLDRLLDRLRRLP